MNDTPSPTTRRRFFGRMSAALAVPLAAPIASAAPSADADAERLAALEAAEAIRALERAYTRLASAGAHSELAGLFVDPSAARAEPGLVRVTPADGDARSIEVHTALSASSSLPCTVELATELQPSCTLVEMARLQGDGVIRRTETRVLDLTYAKQAAEWKIASVSYRAS